MNGSVRKRRRRQQYLSGLVLLFLASYFLSLCTLNPLVHAEILRHAVQTRPSATGHCSRPSAVLHVSLPHAADRHRQHEPLCCEMRKINGKIIPASSVQIEIPPLLFFILAPLDADRMTDNVRPLSISHALHSSRPPPLYLLYITLLL